MHAANRQLAPQPVEWLIGAANVFAAAHQTKRSKALRGEALNIFEERLARIPDEPTRRAYAALPFNQTLFATAAPRRSD